VFPREVLQSFAYLSAKIRPPNIPGSLRFENLSVVAIYSEARKKRDTRRPSLF